MIWRRRETFIKMILNDLVAYLFYLIFKINKFVI